MAQIFRKPELLSPAGNPLKMAAAFEYGADAVYMGFGKFSLREGAANFTLKDYRDSLDEAHSKNKKIYIASNIFFHDNNLSAFKVFMNDISAFPPDGMICSDIGAISYIREKFPSIPIHVSTQANTTNSESAKFYEKLGVKRIIMARELGIDDIRKIRDAVNIELESFIHGAMCISYSGRCLLSNYFTNPSIRRKGERPSSQKREGKRDANLGDCAQSCRWEYYLIEKERSGDLFPVEETVNGTAILSSRDLNLSAHISELIKAGIDSFKIEGRMKSIYYTALTAKVYRYAIDMAMKNRNPDNAVLSELDYVSHRDYTTGFYFHENLALSPVTHQNYIRGRQFLGYVTKAVSGTSAELRSMNRIRLGDRLEFITPGENFIPDNYTLLMEDRELDTVQPDQSFTLAWKTEMPIEKWSILRSGL